MAGRFYPGDRTALAEAVAGHLAAAEGVIAVAPDRPPKAIIAPHAGYPYSGPVAGSAYLPWRRHGDTVRRVVLIGPAHRLSFRGIAASSAVTFATPLGEIPVDREAVAAALRLPEVCLLDEAHAEEHSLEVHLPFLQGLFRDFSVVPLVVGAASEAAVERVLAALWGGPETAIIVSSDLSHYHGYDEAQRLDSAAATAIETLRGDHLADAQACGHRAVRGLLTRARALDLRATGTDLRNSGDTAGPRDRVVGYGAWMFEDAAGARLPETLRETLRGTAREAIAHGVRTGIPPEIDVAACPRPLQAHRATFVTVTLDGRLRGCIGSIEPQMPLVADVAVNACKACFSDPRFPPVTAEEARRLEIGISILSTPRPISFGGEAELIAALRPGVDGLILSEGGRRGLFLPQVWETLPEAPRFLAHLKQKAGFGPGYWSEGIEALRFATESF